MKRLLTSLLFLQFFCACGDGGTASENDLDAARNFLDAALDGKWAEAKSLMVQDSINISVLELQQERYNKRPNEEKVNYMEAHPIFHGSRNIGDSVSIISYSNTYTNKKDSLKIVRLNGKWLVDLKYSFFH